jgi:hypothetical protein
MMCVKMNKQYGWRSEHETTWLPLTGLLNEERAALVERAIYDASEDPADALASFWIEVVHVDQKTYGERMKRSPHAGPMKQFDQFNSMKAADRQMGYTYNRSGHARKSSTNKEEWIVCGVTFRKYREG